MITKANYYAVLGYVTMMLQHRKALDSEERGLALFLKGIVATEVKSWPPRDAVGEAVYNSGDDPEAATAELLERLKLEVEDA